MQDTEYKCGSKYFDKQYIFIVLCVNICCHVCVQDGFQMNVNRFQGRILRNSTTNLQVVYKQGQTSIFLFM